MSGTIEELRRDVGILAETRHRSEKANNEYKHAYNEWYTEKGESLGRARQVAEQAVMEADVCVRTKALALYQETQEKNLIPGAVSIRIKHVPSYDPGFALDWAKCHQIALIPESLDKARYEKLVLLGEAPGKIVEQPEVTIARDLTPPA